MPSGDWEADIVKKTEANCKAYVGPLESKGPRGRLHDAGRFAERLKLD